MKSFIQISGKNESDFRFCCEKDWFRYLVKMKVTLDSVVLLAICVDLFLSRVVRLTKSVSSNDF